MPQVPRLASLGRRAEARRSLLQALPAALAVALTCTALLWVGGTTTQVWAGAPLPRGLAVPLGALGTAGAWWLHAAGRRERRGRLGRARRLARAGGTCLAAGAVLQIVAVPFAGTSAWTIASLALVGVAGFAGLLGGLAGKPRPSGTLAVLCYVVARYGLLAAGAWPPALGAG